MKVHHLNCGTMAFGFVDHCVLVETPNSGLVLIDTGFGLDCVRNPRLLGWTRHAIGPVLRESETAVRQIAALGYDPADVRHVLLTHLDYDHTGGLADFPSATVHVHGPELRASRQPTLVDRIRYRTAQLCGHGVNWQINELDGGEPWFGFDAVRDLNGLPPEILVVPLYGHTRDHVGVAVDTGNGWLLHAGDAYTEPHAIGTGPLTTASRAMHMITAHPSRPRAQWQNMRRLTELVAEQAEDVTVFCSHDTAAFARLARQVV
ncbi:Metallo-beta-lactamase superfamily protein [Mycolicibacterium phlei]|uniref:MBL fold metallo-hydrolase n=1 Tax=Mycobacteroides chelonae TaxID=1774 RepID=UPI000618C2AD|nr:MBL fold metallo-hydrolase [Mycobacteroides chelonae]VEG16452.1 Metallo-beta-lactamase superfamily protein [Mycolicibacterium phlei]AKC38981.1 beta-lactamase [Mycobacteroides chelonae]ANA98296.1 beta-lactamase [Mycobacteroides chelonae CCUG 47445]OLT72113.1 MBL fold metallo-hydrolase [Mycobacteroides chelonae]ORV11434.1 MBL fold metallo-hydrolase [Mycobacteroides chelonae]